MEYSISLRKSKSTVIPLVNLFLPILISKKMFIFSLMQISSYYHQINQMQGKNEKGPPANYPPDALHYLQSQVGPPGPRGPQGTSTRIK